MLSSKLNKQAHSVSPGAHSQPRSSWITAEAPSAELSTGQHASN